MEVLLKVVEEGLYLDVLAWSLECLHLHQLLNGVFNVKSLDGLFEIIGLYLGEVKEVIDEEMEDVGWWVQNALGRADLLEIGRHPFNVVQRVRVVALFHLSLHGLQRFLDLLHYKLDVLVLKQYWVNWVPHLVGDGGVYKLLELDLSFHLVV